jgi:WD40-like Beta Propeller Repeat
LIFSDFETMGVFSLNPGSGKVKPLIQANNNVRYADFNLHPHSSRWTLAVREDHQSGVIENTLVAIDGIAKNVTTIASGHDFYAHPKFSPDGNQICYISWNHPDMPWTGATLYVMAWSDGAVSDARAIAGKSRIESVSQPRWALDGSLLYASDQTGFYQLYRADKETFEAQHVKLKGLEDADFAAPEWFLGR